MKIPNETFKREKLLRLLQKIRQEGGLRQIELANKLGVPQSFVSKYESGDRRLDVLELRHICQAVGISITDFILQLEENLNETK